MSKWTGKSFGSTFGYQFIYYFYKVFGLKATYGFIYLLCQYYYWFTTGPKNTLGQFYQKARQVNKKQALKLVARNFYMLGQCLIDRIAVRSQSMPFQLEYDGIEHIQNMLNEGKGGLLISSHIGNWELAGHLLGNELQATIHILLYDNEIQHVRTFWKNKAGAQQFNIIPIKDDLSHIFEIRKVIRKNELICLHGDRFLPGANTLKLPFMNHQAYFPEGPFKLAHQLKLPVCFVYTAKKDAFSYYFRSSPAVIRQNLEELAHAYVESLEDIFKRFPAQWFNYHSFFE